MKIKLIESDDHQGERSLPAGPPPPPPLLRETILLDMRVQDLREPLVQAGFEVRLVPLHQRGTIPPCPSGQSNRTPILITANVRDWLEKTPNPMALGVSLVNVAAILDHPEGCDTVLLRALTDPDVHAYDRFFWLDYSPSGKRHLMLFVRE
ncbi:MAG: hypothetical protein KA743_00390 [Geothrix sp.]|jgi:hypothetical protein|uniref:Uncharacterized protein n=1 Tax=Candidatus Geothrix odensensis TaxID=2954440 RepID=A0A936F192_9BACT|nr:hypothetical protein [Candidatus Geothrix odensensis]MBP7616939.1 hypothetical protein [Geothrix sp.]